MKRTITFNRIVASIFAHICFIVIIPLLALEYIGKGASFIDDKIHTLNMHVRDELNVF